MMNDSTLQNSPLWEDRWARFSRGLLNVGVVAGKHTFYQAWVRKFFSFLKPKRFEQAERGDVEGYLGELLREGKKGWQVEQASRALELYCREVVPLDWVRRFVIFVRPASRRGIWRGRMRRSISTICQLS